MINSQSKTYIFVVLALVVGLVIGYLGGLYMEQGKRQEIERECFSDFEPEEILSAHGEIKEVGENSLMVELSYSAKTPLGGQEKDKKQVLIGEDTKVVRHTEKTIEELKEEEEAFARELEENPEAELVPPEFFKEEPLSLSELEEGNQVIVEASEDIRDKSSFTASKVILGEF